MASENWEDPDELGSALPSFTPELGSRLSSVVRKIGTHEKAGQLVGVTGEQVGKWLKGRAKPSFFAVMTLARAAGVSLDWLATGEGPMRPGEVAAAPASAPAESPPLLDEELLEIVLAAAEDGLGEAGLELPPVKKARLVTLLYEDLLKEGPGRDAASVRGRVLRLVRLAG